MHQIYPPLKRVRTAFSVVCMMWLILISVVIAIACKGCAIQDASDGMTPAYEEPKPPVNLFADEEIRKQFFESLAKFQSEQKQQNNASTQPTQQTAAIAANANKSDSQAADHAMQPTQQTAAIAADTDAEQTMHNSGPTSQPVQQNGTINYVKNVTNDPRMMYACLAVVALYSRRNSYERGRARRFGREANELRENTRKLINAAKN